MVSTALADKKETVQAFYDLLSNPGSQESSDGFVVAARITMDYTPYFGFAGLDENRTLSFDSSALSMQEELFLRPRIGEALPIC